MEKQRDTRQRRMVYEAVQSRCDHPTADDIYLQIHDTDPHVSKGTVYRNLSLLAEKDQISVVRVPGADRYDLRTDRHYHMICTTCRRVMDAPIAYAIDYDRDIEAATGFRIDRHRLLLEGTCPQCLAAKKDPAHSGGTPSDT